MEIAEIINKHPNIIHALKQNETSESRTCIIHVVPLWTQGRLNFAKWFGDNGPGCLWATKINSLFLWAIGTPDRYRQIIWLNLNDHVLRACIRMPHWISGRCKSCQIFVKLHLDLVPNPDLDPNWICTHHWFKVNILPYRSILVKTCRFLLNKFAKLKCVKIWKAVTKHTNCYHLENISTPR